MRSDLVVAVAAGTVLIASAVLPATATAKATAGRDATVTSVSCASAGNCAAGGQYFDTSRGTHAFVLTERNGAWGTAIEVPGLQALNTGGNADISSVSCAPAGGCAAGGYYQDAKSHFHAFVTTEQNGRWGRLVTVFSSRTKTFVHVDSMSCSARGSCVAGGTSPPFVVSEVHGRWGRPILVQAKDREGNVVVSCVSAGNCTAGWDRFVASKRRGRWGKAIEVPGFTAMNQEGIGALASVTCISAGNCVAGGSAAAAAGFAGGVFEAFLADERNGRWGKVFEVPGIPSPVTNFCEPDSNGCAAGDVLSVSCARGGHCAVGGWYDTPGINGLVAFVASYEHGRWGKIIQVPGLGPLGSAPFSQVNSVSCTPSGSCAAGGENSTGAPMVGPAFVVSGNDGTWGKAQTVRF